MNPEQSRMDEARDQGTLWRKWGPYLSERQWGTVREDYSQTGNAWDYFSHDQSRSRAYRRGEDGLAGISDGKQLLCFAIALWNGADPILKERLFGLTNGEGNHGEDVKEYYFYLDSTPTHSYMRYLYKYPQSAYPYTDLITTNRQRSAKEPEYELIDTGVFDKDRYFDVFVEYAKTSPQDMLIRITVSNAGDQAADLQLLPTLWFRNTWSWGEKKPKPKLQEAEALAGARTIQATHETLGTQMLYCEGSPDLLFTENETNTERLLGMPNATPFVKDAFNEYIVHGRGEVVNRAKVGTKVAAHYRLSIPARGQTTIRLRLRDPSEGDSKPPFGAEFDATFAARRREADEYYRSILSSPEGSDEALVCRQALAGLLWSKQYYSFNVYQWLREKGIDPLKSDAPSVRNREWFHMANDDIISMPDKWEYPWYAAWDLAFHAIAFALADIDFGKQQLSLMLGELYQHPNGQLPAYEWNFGDVNPPVHAFAALALYRMERGICGQGDREFLERVFGKLTMNFTWWVNRKDRTGRNIFEGGFLGLDNIGVFDRSAPLPTGGYIEQADGTAWMAMFCQNMAGIGMELAADNPAFDELAAKFAEHFFWIGSALNRVGEEGMWDDTDGFYYDVLRLPDGRSERLKVRSLVGLLPLAATTIIEPWQRERMPRTVATIRARTESMPNLRAAVHPTGPGFFGVNERGIAALVNPDRLRRILRIMLDEEEFLSPYGLRSISRYHRDHPYILHAGGTEYRVDYLPGESDSGIFGGNSNWRGPIWMPMNLLIIRALLEFYLYHGDAFRIECPIGSGRQMTLYEVAQEIANRLSRIFLRDDQGRRPVFGGVEKFNSDPRWRDNVLFYEYFHGDNGRGVGASHQTGWTALVAVLIESFRRLDAKEFLKHGWTTLQRSLQPVRGERVRV